MMIATQKLTALAFAYYDGMRKDDDLNEDQKSQAIKYLLVVLTLTRLNKLFIKLFFILLENVHILSNF